MDQANLNIKSLATLLFAVVAISVFPSQASAQTDDEDCLACHQDTSKVQSALDPSPLKNSVHSDLSCTDCHSSIEDAEHPKDLPPVNCAECHEDQNAEYENSVHATVRMDDARFQPGCKQCHGTHNILPKKNKDSMINPQNLPTTCGNCHSKPEVMRKFGGQPIDPVALYQLSTHARVAREHPEKHPATCSDCHSAHAIYPPLNPKSTFSKFAIPKTCGKCHAKESEQYTQSLHWDAVQRGHYEAPVCNDCHGEHAAKVPESEDGRVMASTKLCAACHSNEVLMSRFGLDPKRFSSYMKTYHGLAVLRGSPRAASCTSCHEVHAIRSKTDPVSTVHQDNLSHTCGKCHEGASADFAKVSVHPVNLAERNPVAYMFKVFYVWMIIAVIGGMLVHNALIFYYYLSERWREHRHGKGVKRFSTFQVVQHAVLTISFTLLAVTGFALVFSDSGWAQVLSYIGLTEGRRALLHRICAVVLVASSFLQGIYFVAFRSGRRDARALVPVWSDVVGLWQNVRFHLRMTDEPPRFARFNYIEKAEYLALIWGTLVMAVTGFVLWFPERAMQLFPIWMFEVSEVIHFYEAVLAVSAIIVWHLFFTIFHPEQYPMSMTWLDGKISRHEQEHHHPLEDTEQEK